MRTIFLDYNRRHCPQTTRHLYRVDLDNVAGLELRDRLLADDYEGTVVEAELVGRVCYGDRYAIVRLVADTPPAPVHVSDEWIGSFYARPTNERSPFTLDWLDEA